MTRLTAAGHLLTASTADRRLGYRLLPFGEPGRTSLGRVTAAAGAVTVPPVDDLEPVNEEHDATRPVGRFVHIEETDAGIECVIEIARTRAGDDALELAATGLRKGISVEIDDARIRSGKLLAGRLSGAGLVVKPAYASALLTASDTPDADDDEHDDDAPAGDDDAAGDPDPGLDDDAPAGDDDEAGTTPPPPAPPATPEGNDMHQNLAQLAATLTAAANGTAPGTGPSSYRRLLATLDGGAADSDPRRLTAAELDTITQADAYDVVATPEYVGELWRQRSYRPRFTPLVSNPTLTSSKVTGWSFETGYTPEVDDWNPPFTGTGRTAADTMTDIPTNEVRVVEQTWNAARLAGGHRLDRIHVDLPTPGFWEAYLRESNDDFARKLDAKVAAHLLNTAPAVTAAGADAKTVWSHLLLAAATVNDVAAPTGIIMGNKLWRALGGTVNDNVLSFLGASLGLADEDGNFGGIKIQAAPITNTLWDNKITVVADGCTRLHTLPGGPVRVSAEVINKGAIDHGVFGYYALYTSDVRGLAQVTVPDAVLEGVDPADAPAA